jgi:hypothetical protein
MTPRRGALTIVTIVMVLQSGVALAWNGPTGLPPSANVSAPVNVSSTFQDKPGALWADGGMGINSGSAFCIGGSCITAWAQAGAGSSVTGPYIPNYAGWASSGTGAGGAAIYNDNASYKSLMVVGNSSAGGLREVHVWDDLTVNNNLYVDSSVGVDTATPGYPLDVNGVIRGNNEIVSSNISGYGNFRMIGGNYGAFLRNDGTYTYLLLTASGNQYGAWNALRPFYINDATGVVGMNSGLALSGGLTSDVVTAPQYCIGASCITAWAQAGAGGSVGGSGTAGTIPRFTAASALGNSSLTSDGNSTTANGNFFTGSLIVNGGGSWTPGAIYSDSNWGMLFRARVVGSLAAFSFHNAADSVNILNMYDNGNVNFGGNVGIGTASPGFKLHVAGDVAYPSDIPNGGSQFSITGATDPNKRINIGYDTSSGNGFGFIAAGKDGTAWTNLALQPTGGNVGIGTLSPVSTLQVKGTGTFGTDANGTVSAYSTATEGGTIDLRGSNGANMFVESLNGTFRLVNNGWTAGIFSVDQNGNVGAAASFAAPMFCIGSSCITNWAEAGNGSTIGGSGSGNQLAKFTGGTSIGNSNISDDGTYITLGSAANHLVGSGTDNWFPYVTGDNYIRPASGHVTYLRGPLYDEDNTAYYLDPNNGSVLNGLTVSNLNPVSCINGVCPPNGAIRMTPNFHFNSGAGYAVITNWDNGTTGSSQTFRIGNGAGADSAYFTANGQLVVTNNVQVPTLCLSGDCRSAWPAGSIGGSGTAGNVPRFSTNGTTLGNSSLTSDGNSTTANGNFFVTNSLNWGSGVPQGALISGNGDQASFNTVDSAITSWWGLGLRSSCCGNPVTYPIVFDTRLGSGLITNN